MTYRIEGLSPDLFAPLFTMDEAGLAARGAMRVVAVSSTGYPCRVTLTETAPGDDVVVLSHVTHDVSTPFRTVYAIAVRQGAREAASWRDEIPAVLGSRTLGLRGFGADGMLKAASLALPGETDAKVRELLDHPEIMAIHAHNATCGCFLAKIERN